MIEELPDLPFGLILRFLNGEDRLSLRRACKKLKRLVDGQVGRNLFVFLDCYPCHRRLFCTGESVYRLNSYRVPDFSRFITSEYKEKFKQIKKFAIFFEGLYSLKNYAQKAKKNSKSLSEEDFFQEVWRLEIDLDRLNFFEMLEHLEIHVS